MEGILILLPFAFLGLFLYLGNSNNNIRWDNERREKEEKARRI